MFYLVDILRTLVLGDKTFRLFWGTAPKRQGWENQDIYNYFAKKKKRPGSKNIKRLLLIKVNWISQVKESSAHLCMGGYRILGPLKLFLWYALKLSGASIQCFLILNFIRVHHRGWLPWLLLGRLGSGQPICLHPGFCQGSPSRFTIRAAVMWWLDGCNILCLLIWLAIFFIYLTLDKVVSPVLHLTLS